MASGVSGVDVSDDQNMELGDLKKATVTIAMLTRIANSDAHFKHQQRGEPNLSIDEKRQIAAEVLHRNPSTFLSRFGRFLTTDDLEYFDDMKDQYEIKFYLKEIHRYLDDKKNETKKRNRRFEAMKKMMEQGEYFSAEEMKDRDPLLYEHLIGQYQTQEEIQSQVEGKDLNFSAVLIDHVQALANTALYEELKGNEFGQMEEGDSDEEDMHDTESTDEHGVGKMEKQMLKNEFLRTMQLRFLNGEDDFNYRDVDENEEFDSLDIREQDEEEKYFDDDDDVDSLHSSVTFTSETDLKLCHEKTDITNNERLRAQDQSATSDNCMDCTKGDLNQDNVIDSNSENVIDYNDYVVTTDICPGLHAAESSRSTQITNDKSDDTVT